MTQRAATLLNRNALKTAVKRLVATLGGLEAAASCTRVQKSQLADYGSVAAEDRHMPVDVVLDLERIAGEPLITEALANAQGFLLLPVELPGEGDIAHALEDVAASAGTTMSDALRAVSGGMLPAESARLTADLTALVRAATHAVGLLNQRAAPRPVAPAAGVAEPSSQKG